VSEIVTTAQPFTQEPLRRIEVVCQVDKPQVAAISQALDELSARGDALQVHEFNGVICSRQHAAQQIVAEPLVANLLTSNESPGATAHKQVFLTSATPSHTDGVVAMNRSPVAQSDEKKALVRVAEPLVPVETSMVTRVQEDLRQVGIAVGEIKSSEQGNQRYSEMAIHYTLAQPHSAQISQALDKVSQQAGVTVEESLGDRSERRQAAQISNTPATISKAHQLEVEH